MVTDIFDAVPCLPGLFLAALFSASLSYDVLHTGQLVCHILGRYYQAPHTKPMFLGGTVITRISVLAFGVIGIFIAFVVSGLTGPISQILMTTGSCLNGALTGIFLLGWCCPRANKLGALTGGSLCVLMIGWIPFGKYVSSGVRVSTKLPPAATDRCFVSNGTNAANNTYYTTYTNITTELYSSDHHDIPTTMTPPDMSRPKLQPKKKT
ncbi:sodium-coupled monocarboxylate transporter 2-like [Argopecten irradians]|uniref:sodium-coupled monocarboxylate transporter 2-like n=1 Tax=Argopecten irradians TaxID=31199 RepID=UPI003712ACE0